jgi:hypothetical protein
MVKKQDGCHNLAAILFLPFEIQTKKVWISNGRG